MKQTTSEWLKAANDDLKAAKSLFADESLTNITAFHCQQAIEKSLKALLEEYNNTLNKTHNLQTLIFKSEDFLMLKYDEMLIAEIDRLYIDSRYPGNQGLMSWGKPSLDETRRYLDQANEIIKQIRDFVNLR